jgi:hypothetical protein
MSISYDRRIVYIDSAKRISGDDSNFSYQIQLPPESNFDKAAVLECSIPKSYYLISSINDTFTLVEGDTDTTVTLTHGNYGIRALANELILKLEAASAYLGNHFGYDVTFPNIAKDPSTGKFTFTANTEPTGIIPTFIFGSNSPAEVMGFAANSENPFDENFQLTSTQVMKLIPEDTLYIHSDMVANSGSSGLQASSGDNILQEIFTSGVPNFGIIKYQSYDPMATAKKFASTGPSSVYHFYLTDENNKPINLNGLNWQMAILLYKENDTFRILRDISKIYLANVVLQ